MNAYDWLANLPFSDPESSCRVVEISFNNGSRKDYFRNNTLNVFEKGEMVAVEGVSGFDVGMINLTGEVVRLQLRKRNINEYDPEMKKILRRAGDRDLELMRQNKAREAEAVIRARAIAKQLNLDMKISEVEFQADGRKATFFYIADGRVDFRELIKVYAREFKVKVEMRQIGARQEAGKVGGIGSCGRELCCSTWLTDFKSVNTTAARYQNLSINQSKLSGQCGRLKCCLNYELDTYLDALQHFPENADTLQVAKGTATLIKKDIFRNLMWYILPDSNKQYPVTIERVKKIKFENSKNIIPEELEAVEVTSIKPKEMEPEFVDVVGQISLRSLEKSEKRRRGGGGGQKGGGQRGGAQGGDSSQQKGGRGQQRDQQRNDASRHQRGGQQQRGAQGGDASQQKGGQPQQGGQSQRGHQQKGDQSQQGGQPPRNHQRGDQPQQRRDEKSQRPGSGSQQQK